MIAAIVTYLIIASGILYCWRISRPAERAIEEMDKWSDDVVEQPTYDEELPGQDEKHLEIDVFGALREVTKHPI